MKVLVTGYAGQLGYEVVRLLDARGVECRFKATGYDPSDPLRGRYVRFQADVSTTAVDEALSDYFHKAYFQLSETPDAAGLTPVLRCAAADFLAEVDALAASAVRGVFSTKMA